MKEPKVSIIVPCYNQSQYLSDALTSVLNQTYQNWECLIINDGSTDETEQIAKEWIKTNDRFKYIYKINGGLASARNRGLLESHGDFIQFLDADDFLEENKLKFSMEENNTIESEIVITNFKYLNDNSKETTSPNFQLSVDFMDHQNILMLWPSINIPVHCGLFSSDLFKDFLFPEELKAWEDWIMWIKVLEKKPKISFINKPLALYRKYPFNMTSDTFLMEKYHLKAVNYILNNITLEKKFKNHFEELQNYKNKTRKLENTIKNYRNTRTYKCSQFLQNQKIVGFMLGLKRYFQK